MPLFVWWWERVYWKITNLLHLNLLHLILLNLAPWTTSPWRFFVWHVLNTTQIKRQRAHFWWACCLCLVCKFVQIGLGLQRFSPLLTLTPQFPQTYFGFSYSLLISSLSVVAFSWHICSSQCSSGLEQSFSDMKYPPWLFKKLTQVFHTSTFLCCFVCLWYTQ